MTSPSLQPISQFGFCASPARSILPSRSRAPTHLHLTLALAKVLSSEFPSHIRLGAAPGHTTQGNSLQFLHFQY